MARLGSTAGAAATYILLAGLQRGVSLLILPFITHVMSPDEYGAASLVTTASLFLTAVIAAPLVQLIIRAAARPDGDSLSLLRAAGVYCYLVMPIVGVIAALAVATLVPRVLGVPGLYWGIELLAIGLQPAASTFALSIVQARENLPRFAAISLTAVLTTAISKLVFLVVLQLGVLGWVVSDLVSAVISAVVAMALVRLPRAALSLKHIRYVLSFALPLIPHSASFWALTSLSRPAMASVSTLDQVGLLSFGLNLAQVAGLVLSETNRATLRRYSREAFPAPSGETFAIVQWQLIAAFAVPSAIGCGVAVAGPWMFAEAYWQSFPLTGILLIGQAAYGLYVVPMNYLTQTAGLPKYSAFASGAGAILILIWILLWGRQFAAVGVAYATATGYLTMASVALVLTRLHSLDIRWHAWIACSPALLLSAGALGCSVAALALPRGSSVWILTGASLVLIIGAACLAARRALPQLDGKEVPRADVDR